MHPHKQPWMGGGGTVRAELGTEWSGGGGAYLQMGGALGGVVAVNNFV